MTQQSHYLAICGGVGGAKLALGLSRALDSDELSIAVNTADDFEHLGLHIAPDVDTVVYTLAGLNDPAAGWGRRDETWNFMQALRELGGETWFALGDRDLAVNVVRTFRLRRGQTLSQVTRDFAKSFGISIPILPMSDDRVSTRVITAEGELAFQHYFVRDRCKPAVTGFRFDGVAQARLNPDIAGGLESPRLAGVILCPSNPFVSIDPILALPGMRPRLQACEAPVIAVSPVVGGAAIKGPTAKMMQELALPVSATGIAEHYQDFLDGIVIDTADAALAPEIEAKGIRTTVTNTVMVTLEDRERLADHCLQWLGSLHRK